MTKKKDRDYHGIKNESKQHKWITHVRERNVERQRKKKFIVYSLENIRVRRYHERKKPLHRITILIC